MGIVRSGVGLAVLPTTGRPERARRRQSFLHAALRKAMRNGLSAEDREGVTRVLRDAGEEYDKQYE